MCITDEFLRAKLDGELTQAESRAVEGHMAACADCRRRAEIMAGQAERIHTLLSALTPLPGEATADARQALARFRARQNSAEREKPSILRRLFAGRLGPAWGALAALVLVVVFIGFTPVRSWADRILGLFRVQKITVVGIDTPGIADLQSNSRVAKLITQLISDHIVVTKEPGEAQRAASADQASQLAGFPVRLPDLLSCTPQLEVEDNQAFYMTIDRARLQAILDEAGRPDLQLPASVDGATVTVDIPNVVVATYGDCMNFEENKTIPPLEHDWGRCVVLAQLPSPTVITPPDLNMAEVAAVGLQLAGMSADKARAFSKAIDWTSTLVIAIPRDMASYQTVEVAGVKGTLIQQRPRNGRPAGYSLLWVKDGIVYSLMGYGDAEQAISLAESLR